MSTLVQDTGWQESLQSLIRRMKHNIPLLRGLQFIELSLAIAFSVSFVLAILSLMIDMEFITDSAWIEFISYMLPVGLSFVLSIHFFYYLYLNKRIADPLHALFLEKKKLFETGGLQISEIEFKKYSKEIQRQFNGFYRATGPFLTQGTSGLNFSIFLVFLMIISAFTFPNIIKMMQLMV